MSDIKERIPVAVNSLDRSSGTVNSFIYKINEEVKRVVEVEIISIEIPYTYYPINSNNNILLVTPSGNPDKIITITPGIYTSTSLALELQTQLDAVLTPSTHTVAYDTRTRKLTIVASSALAIRGYDDTPTSPLSRIIGFADDTVNGLSHTGTGSVVVSGSNYIVVKSVFLTSKVGKKMIYANDNYKTALATIPVDENPGSVIVDKIARRLKLGNKVTISPLDSIDFTLEDDQGNTLNLNGVDWAMQMVFITD